METGERFGRDGIGLSDNADRARRHAKRAIGVEREEGRRIELATVVEAIQDLCGAGAKS